MVINQRFVHIFLVSFIPLCCGEGARKATCSNLFKGGLCVFCLGNRLSVVVSFGYFYRFHAFQLPVVFFLFWAVSIAPSGPGSCRFFCERNACAVTSLSFFKTCTRGGLLKVLARWPFRFDCVLIVYCAVCFQDTRMQPTHDGFVWLHFQNVCIRPVDGRCASCCWGEVRQPRLEYSMYTQHYCF